MIGSAAPETVLPNIEQVTEHCEHGTVSLELYKKRHVKCTQLISETRSHFTTQMMLLSNIYAGGRTPLVLSRFSLI